MKQSEKLGTWPESWAPSLWKGWVASALFVMGVVLVLLQVLRETPISEGTLALLRNNPSWPLWLILLPSVLAIFGLSAAFIWLLQIWDSKRVDDAEKQLKIFAGEKSIIEVERIKIEKELQTKDFALENIRRDYQESERLRRLDLITGVPNYLAWSADLREWTKTGKTNTLCLILIDIDKLKWLNDRNRECADLVLRYFAQQTMSTMRRDEQMYKSTAKMYRHYQGGDEFFFVVNGNVFDAIGFTNRLGDRVRVLYQAKIREAILSRYLAEEDADYFRLSFSGAVIGPGNLSLEEAYQVLERAKGSAKSRLMVVFDSAYEEPFTQREKLEKMRENLQQSLIELQLKADSGDEESKEIREDLLKDETKLDANINVLKKAEQVFPAFDR
jgi:GGDEF domain-containing protein